MNSLELVVVVLLLAVAAAAWWLLRRRDTAAAPTALPPSRAPAASTSPVTVSQTGPSQVVQVHHVEPPELEGFRLVDADKLPPERRQSYVAMFRAVPRPPRLMAHLLSPDFLSEACSAQLTDLIAAEPLIAAKVLATVNSPMYSLSRPVTGISNAVTVLGLDTVRSVCVQYIMISSFRADTPERQRLLDDTWAASALASAMTQQLSAQLGLEDRSSLVSAAVLSFLGRLAAVATTPAAVLGGIPSRDLLQRTIAEQARLGLGSSEIGRLLMTEWGLPGCVVQDAADVDRMLIRPLAPTDGSRTAGLALCYLCARVAERLASGELADLEAFDLETQAGAELHHVRSHVRARPALARLPWLLRSPEVVEPLRRMQAAVMRR